MLYASWHHHWNTVTSSCLSNFLPGTRTQLPISKTIFMPIIPPNLSPDLTSQQFYSHTLYCLPDSSNSDVHRTCASAETASPATYRALPCHVSATWMVFLPLYPSLSTEMLSSLQRSTQMIDLTLYITLSSPTTHSGLQMSRNTQEIFKRKPEKEEEKVQISPEYLSSRHCAECYGEKNVRSV